MLKKIILFCLLLVTSVIYAQRKSHEIGIFTGVSYYMGDLNQSKLFSSPGIATGLLYRNTLNKHYAIKFKGIYSIISGNDANSNNSYQQQRAHRFRIPLTEITANVEFNFLPFAAGSLKDYYSVYVTAGLGIFIMQSPGSSPVHPVIPFGVGFKYAISKRLIIAAEWTYHKTFTDYIDQLPPDEIPQNGSSIQKQNSYNNSKDWYSFAGISLTYKFALGSSSCPAYGFK